MNSTIALNRLNEHSRRFTAGRGEYCLFDGLDALELTGKKTLLLTNDLQANVYKSGKNIPKVNVVEADKASTYDLLNNQILLLQKGAIEKLESTFN